MAENVIKSLSEDFVHCTICTEPYNEPKMLPCLHSFCLQCLERWTSNRHDQLFSCPTCRCAVDMPSSGIGGLPNNFFLVSLKERLEEVTRLSRQNPDYNCNICKSKIDILFCLDCKMNICDGCRETHDRFTRSNDHPMIPSDKLSDESYLKRVMSTQAPYCDTHKQEKLRYYCTECSHLACQVCATVSHQGHQSLQEVKSRVTSIKAKFENLLEESIIDFNVVLDKSKETARTTEEMHGQIAELHRKIDSRYQELMAKLESDRQKLLAELNTVKNEKCAKLDDIDENISKWLRTMENSQTMTRAILAQDNPWEILEMEKSIVESFERLRSDKDQMTKLSIPATVHYNFLPVEVSVFNETIATNYNQQQSFLLKALQEAKCRRQYQRKSKEDLVDEICHVTKELKVLKAKIASLKPLPDMNILGILNSR